MRVKVPCIMGSSIGWPLMKPHRIGTLGLEEPVVPAYHPLRGFREAVSLVLAEPIEAGDVPIRQQEDLIRPDGPVRHKGGAGVVAPHDALFACSFEGEIVAQQTRAS